MMKSMTKKHYFKKKVKWIRRGHQYFQCIEGNYRKWLGIKKYGFE